MKTNATPVIKTAAGQVASTAFCEMNFPTGVHKGNPLKTPPGNIFNVLSTYKMFQPLTAASVSSKRFNRREIFRRRFQIITAINKMKIHGKRCTAFSTINAYAVHARDKHASERSTRSGY